MINQFCCLLWFSYMNTYVFYSQFFIAITIIPPPVLLWAKLSYRLTKQSKNRQTSVTSIDTFTCFPYKYLPRSMRQRLFGRALVGHGGGESWCHILAGLPSTAYRGTFHNRLPLGINCHDTATAGRGQSQFCEVYLNILFWSLSLKYKTNPLKVFKA